MKVVDTELSYVNWYYSMNLKKGQIVKTPDGNGKVLGGNSWVYVRIRHKIHGFHPQDITVIKESSEGAEGK